MWNQIKNGETIGQIGSEGGTILVDDEYRGCCRITLEKDGVTAPYSITCGIYGLMVHTAFSGGKVDAETQYEEMKKELQIFVDSDGTDDTSFCERFVNKW